MSRFPYLRSYLRWWGLLEVGVEMRDGRHYQTTVGDDRNFPEPPILVGIDG